MEQNTLDTFIDLNVEQWGSFSGISSAFFYLKMAIFISHKSKTTLFNGLSDGEKNPIGI